MREARLKLKASTFLVWTYFSENQNGYDFALSREDVLKSCNISKSTYDRAIKELIDMGYLIPYIFPNGIKGYEFLQEGKVSSNLTHDVSSKLSHDVSSNFSCVSSNLTHTWDKIEERNNTNNTMNNTKIIQNDNTGSLLSIEDIPQNIQNFAQSFSQERQIECLTKVAALHDSKNYSYDLLFIALNMKEINDWQRYGFGLLYKEDFIKQAELSLASQEKVQQQRIESAAEEEELFNHQALLLSQETGMSLKDARLQLQLEQAYFI